MNNDKIKMTSLSFRKEFVKPDEEKDRYEGALRRKQLSLILAGKVGSSIAGQLGTMKVTEQIDALEVMGVNSLNYLVFPKIIALLLYPFVIGIAMFLTIRNPVRG